MLEQGFIALVIFLSAETFHFKHELFSRSFKRVSCFKPD